MSLRSLSWGESKRTTSRGYKKKSLANSSMQQGLLIYNTFKFTVRHVDYLVTQQIEW